MRGGRDRRLAGGVAAEHRIGEHHRAVMAEIGAQRRAFLAPAADPARGPLSRVDAVNTPASSPPAGAARVTRRSSSPAITVVTCTPSSRPARYWRDRPGASQPAIRPRSPRGRGRPTAAAGDRPRRPRPRRSRRCSPAALLVGADQQVEEPGRAGSVCGHGDLAGRDLQTEPGLGAALGLRGAQRGRGGDHLRAGRQDEPDRIGGALHRGCGGGQRPPLTDPGRRRVATRATSPMTRDCERPGQGAGRGRSRRRIPARSVPGRGHGPTAGPAHCAALPNDSVACIVQV